MVSELCPCGGSRTISRMLAVYCSCSCLWPTTVKSSRHAVIALVFVVVAEPSEQVPCVFANAAMVWYVRVYDIDSAVFMNPARVRLDVDRSRLISGVSNFCSIIDQSA